MLEELGDARAKEFAAIAGVSRSSRDERMSNLGSKGGSKRPSGKQGVNAPYLRADLAQWVQWGELSPNVKELVWHWAQGTLEPGATISRPSQPSKRKQNHHDKHRA